MSVWGRAVHVAALLAVAGCGGDDVVYVPLSEFADVPLHGEFGYFDDARGPGQQTMASVELDRHPACSALNESYTATFNGQRIEASNLGGLGPSSGDQGPTCSWPFFPVLEARTSNLPGTFSDGELVLEDASHRMRMRVKDWIGPHGPVLPAGPVDVRQGEDLAVPWQPASADLSRLTAHVSSNGVPGSKLPTVAEAGVLRVKTAGLAAGAYSIGFDGFAEPQVLECTGTPRCDVSVRPHYSLHVLQVRVLAP